MRKRLLAWVMTVVIVLSVGPHDVMKGISVEKEVRAAQTLSDPQIVSDSSRAAGQKVTYDCVWFGNYPRTEIVDQAVTCGTYGKVWGENSDYEENKSLYSNLSTVSGWDDKGDITIDGTKYRRIRSSNAINYGSDDHLYRWNSTSAYHYFRYEPIKWRVLHVSDNQAILLADQVLDSCKYNLNSNDITWKNSTIRSWLNGYTASFNTAGIGYTVKNFINTAFTTEERELVVSTLLKNSTTGPYSGTYGGEDTKDKVYLLSADDLYGTELAASYGFYSYSYSRNDEARRRTSTTYAKAMGVYSSTGDGYQGRCWWWLRSPGQAGNMVINVNNDGQVLKDGDEANSVGKLSVCPALTLSLSDQKAYSYAGTISTDGTMKEVEPGSAPVTPANTRKSQTITASDKTIAINNKSVTVGAKTNGNGKLTYTSSAKSVATVSASGAITPKKYGTTKITIKAAATSTYKAATKTVTVTVVPKKMTLTTVKSPAKKTLFLKWKKDKEATKYEVQLCMKKDFKEKTLSRRFGKKVVKQKIKNMRSKTWYVRIRVWKKVGGKTYYGIWSKVKKVKIR